MKCFYCGKEAIGVCKYCGKAICADCGDFTQEAICKNSDYCLQQQKYEKNVMSFSKKMMNPDERNSTLFPGGLTLIGVMFIVFAILMFLTKGLNTFVYVMFGLGLIVLICAKKYNISSNMNNNMKGNKNE